ncbi:uncharacterized protein YKL023W-like [Miscanthus floridulus]|uniref:uncharacterized protein YKL023W-like n=1 Tax=Miscanthus floridulus TaxID=154761 RepID=UPI003458ADAE
MELDNGHGEEREGIDKDEKEDEDKKKKSVAFKTSSSSKNKGKFKKQESSDDEDASDIDDEVMALFVHKMGKFMKKKGYGARKRRDNFKSKDYVRRSDEEEKYTKEELMDKLEQVHTCFEMKRKECKELRKKVKSLEQFFDELNASHESLREDHEKLVQPHTKLEKVHSSLHEQVKKEEAKKEQVIVSYDLGLSCDILDESFYKPIVVAPTNPS